MSAGDSFYSPGRIKLLLWRYDDLVILTKGVAQGSEGESGAQRTVREIAEGGFEPGASIKSDLDTALRQLEPIVRRVVWDYYVGGYAAVEIARSIPGVNRWFVDRARQRGPREMAYLLGWRPKAALKALVSSLDDLDEREVRTRAEMQERMKLIVARALDECPARGPIGLRCPVIGCNGVFAEDGQHGDA
jgi:hypothetical protein